MSLPLEIIDSEYYGDFDDEQKRLICDVNAYDLVLIENASELFREMAQDENNLELMLRAITKESSIDYLDSETFPLYVKKENRSFFPDYLKNAGYYVDNMNENIEGREEFINLIRGNSKNKGDVTLEEYLKWSKNDYENIVKIYRQKINRNAKYVSVIGVDIPGSGGHYAAFYYEKNTVKLFDSMQGDIDPKEAPSYRKKYGKRISSAGGYTVYFIQLLEDIFPGTKPATGECIKNEVSPQYTGGFPENPPYTLEVEEKRRKRERETLLQENVVNDLKVQSTESQNHFCYMWSIFWVHLKVVGPSLNTILPMFKKYDPLILIKRYIWSLTHILKLNNKINNIEIFNKHFMSIWSNEENGRLTLNFGRYDIPKPKKGTHVHDAVNDAIRQVLKIPKPNTKLPKKVEEICKQKKQKK